MHQRLCRLLNTLTPLLIYCTLALAFMGCGVDWSKYYFGYAADSLVYVWCLHWWPYALTHGLNPFLTKFLWAPAGYNLAWATSIPLLAIAAWPITALAGPVVAYNVLALAAPALAAFTAFLLGRELTRSWAASLVCGALFGFSAPELFQAGELNIASVFLIPLAILLCLRHVRATLRRRHFIILLSIVLTAQLGISTEMLATLCLMGVFFWPLALAFAPAPERAKLWRLALDIAIAAPLTACLSAPFLYNLVSYLPNVPATLHPNFLFASELLYFFVPAVPVTSATAALLSIARQTRGYLPDYYTYISAPLLLITVIYFCRHIRLAYVRALLALLIIVAVLSLGTRLIIDGHITKIPLPWLLFSRLPILGNIIPDRLPIYLALGTAIIAALFLAEAKTPAARLPRYALAGLACLFLPPAKLQLLPAQWQTQPIFQEQTALKWSAWPAQPFFTPAHIRAALGPMPNVLLLPDPGHGPGMAWQVNAGLSFVQTDGYIGPVPVPEQKWDVAGQLVWGPPSPDFATKLTAFAAAHKLDYILIGPGTPGTITAAIEALGWKRRMDSGIEIVQTPNSLLPFTHN